VPGPLEGVRVVEFAAIGPAPHAVMMLADLGADVIRIDRVSAAAGRPGTEITSQGMARNRRSLAVDLKQPEGIALVHSLLERSDVVIEGFRPGVMERLGFAPDLCLERNPGLVYGRMTGWGQQGALATTAGHDINYAAVTGALHAIGPADRPPPVPLNLIADFGGGATYLAFGVVAALLHRERTGEGQVVDAAMVDGVTSLTSYFHGLIELGMWTVEREANLLDGAAPFYCTYRTADHGYVAVGAIEPQFHAALLETLQLDPAEFPQEDRESWPEQKRRLAEVFASRTRDEWAELFADSDACVSPVLSFSEAPTHAHLQERRTFVERSGRVQPAPAPRFSQTPGSIVADPPGFGEHTDEILAELGVDDDELAALRARRVVG
jgi:alpha-methylacyl-CoA racemase